MYPTSQRYKDNVYAPVRRAVGKVTFDISDVTAAGDVISTVTSAEQSGISDKSQLVDKKRNTTYNLATLETNRFKLDGSFSFPDDTLANNGELGFCSNNLCAADGSFINYADTANFVGKVSGSTVENPHIAKGASISTSLLTPSGAWESEFVNGYNSANKLDGTLVTTTASATNGRISQQLFSFDLIALVERKYGTIPGATTAEKVAWLKANVTKLTANWHGFGSGPAGNKAYFTDWVSSTSQWGVQLNATYARTHSLSTVGMLSIQNTSTVNNIDANGFVHFLAYAEASNGTIASTINTDYVELIVNFQMAPQITFNFGSTHSSIGLTITYDNVNNEYAVDYNVSVYDAASALITSVDVVGNTGPMATPVGQLNNYKKVVLTIKKWSVGDRRARVLEVDFGIVKVYTDNNLISMGLIEEIDLTTAKLPSAEFDFTVDNSAREFNILNPNGFYKGLQQRQQVIAEIGIDVGGGFIEYVQLGNYLLWDWTSDEGSLTASFTARTNLDLMASFDYENLIATSKTLYQLAVDMFVICGITNYSIDTGLQSITTNALVKKTNCRNVLQMIAIAGCANIYVTRGNVITLKVLPTLLGPAVDTLTLDNMYKEPQINLDKVVKQADVTYWSNISTSAVTSVAASGVTVGDTLKLSGNTLINDSTRATAVGNWILAQMNYRAVYKANWRGNPAHELTDIISLQNTYGSNMIAFVTKNQIDYKGYLSAQTEAKGVPN